MIHPSLLLSPEERDKGIGENPVTDNTWWVMSGYTADTESASQLPWLVVTQGNKTKQLVLGKLCNGEIEQDTEFVQNKRAIFLFSH